jgi:5-methylcytosine-specific restriction enzyme subunit McrC
VTSQLLRAKSFPRVLVRLTEWDSLDPSSSGQGSSLRGLSFADDTSAQQLIKSLERRGVVSVSETREGISIKTGSYIGRIAVGPLDIVIVPKISWYRWLTLIGFALRLRGLERTSSLEMHLSTDALQDLIVLELLAESNDLISHGLHRDYARHHDSLRAPRGRIDFHRLASRGGLSIHEAKRGFAA